MVTPPARTVDRSVEPRCVGTMRSVDRGTDAGSGGFKERAPHGAITTPRGSGPITLGLVVACLAGTLLIGAAHKAPCAGG